MREIITRFGRHNIGFAWLFAEPMLFTIGIMLLWSLLKESAGAHHISIIAFALTGYSTILAWRNTIGRCTMAIEPNQTLLFHRNVRVIDLFIARIILELSGATLSMIILVFGLSCLSIIDPPHNIFDMIIGWGMIAWYAAGMALLIGGLTEFSEVVDRLWHPIAYFQLPISGAFAMNDWLPEKFRNIVLLFPLPNCVDLFRYGYFGDAVKPHYDLGYVAILNLLITWGGLAVVSAAAKRVGNK